MEKSVSNIENLEKNENLISKRILFDKKTLKMIEMMLPTYKDEILLSNKENEKLSEIIKLSIEKMFKNDFLNKIKEF